MRKVSFDYYAHPTQRHNLVPPTDEGIDLDPPTLGLEFVQFAREDGVEEKLIVLRPDLETTSPPKLRRPNYNNNNNNNISDNALESGVDEKIEADRQTLSHLLTKNDNDEEEVCRGSFFLKRACTKCVDVQYLCQSSIPFRIELSFALF